MSETLSTIFEESSASSSTLENFQEEGAQQLHETYVSFESCTDGESNSEINASSPPLPPGLTKLNTTIRLGLYSKMKFCNKENTITSDIDPAETTPSKNDPNSSRSFNKSINFSRFTSFFRPNATSPSTTTSDHDHLDIHDDQNEMFALRERVTATEILVEKQQLEIDTLRQEAMETRSMLQELRTQMEQIVQSQAPALPLPEVAACDLVDLLSF
ncbi:hypothetical protein ACE6H2_026909 [Prunus campanulata]